MAQRLSQAKLQRLQVALSAVIHAIHDARVRYRDCRELRPRRLAGFSAFLRDLLALPHSADYRLFEVQLKRRLVRTQHRLFGRDGGAPGDCSLDVQLPSVYLDVLENYRLASRELLKALADVDITANHQPQLSVKALLERQQPPARVQAQLF